MKKLILSPLNWLRVITVFCLLLTFSCTISKQSTTAVKNTTPKLENYSFDSSDSFNKKKSFDVSLQLDKKGNQHFIVANLELNNGSYVISPFSKDTVYGHFDISLQETNFLSLEKPILEMPSAVEEFDPILEMPVKFVRQNTTYKQQVSIAKQDDFEVEGSVWFLLEPSCVPYEMDFTLSSVAGEMKIQDAGVKVHESYKGK